ncbi:MAG: autotransporter-associated beta strand repeat-containing protein [Verrucomicrobiota bacterium]
MKTIVVKNLFVQRLACLLVLILAASSAHALYWDANDTADGAGGSTPTGTWGTDTYWSTNSEGTNTTTGWTDGQIAVFSAGTDATGTFTVNVTGTQAPAQITVQEGNLTLAGGTLDITNTVVQVDNASATINSVITSSTGLGLGKFGVGPLTIGGANIYNGPTLITNGILRLGASGVIPDSSAVNIASTMTLDLNGFNETVGSLAGAGIVTLGSASLSAGGNDTSTTFSGAISGTGGLIKKGAGKLTLSGTTSSYTGSTKIEAGAIAVNATAKLGDSANLLELAGGTLEISISRVITNQISVTGDSQLSGSVGAGTRTLTFLTGSFTTTSGSLKIRNTGTGGGISVRLRSGDLNITRPIQIGQVGDANGAATNAFLRCDHQSGGDQIISGDLSGPGIFERNSNLSLGGFRTILTGNNSYSGRTDLRGGFVGIGSDTALGTSFINIGQDPQLLGFFAHGSARTVPNNIVFEATTAAATNLVLTGPLPLTFSGSMTLHPGNSSRLTVSNGMVATISGIISGTTGLEKTETATLILSGANLYGGNTIVNGGTLLVNNTAGSGTGAGNVTINSGLIGGSGRITGTLTVNSGGTLSPGASIGTLVVSNNVTLAGNTLIEINKTAATYDQLIGVNTLTYGGTLTVTNASGTLAAGDSFPVFSATSYTGSFSSIAPATPGDGLAWSLANGILSVVNATPPTLQISQAGNTLTFSWSGSFKLQSQTNALTVGISTNWSDYPGGNSSPVNATIDAANPTVFYRLISP